MTEIVYNNETEAKKQQQMTGGNIKISVGDEDPIGMCDPMLRLPSIIVFVILIICAIVAYIIASELECSKSFTHSPITNIGKNPKFLLILIPLIFAAIIYGLWIFKFSSLKNCIIKDDGSKDGRHLWYVIGLPVATILLIAVFFIFATKCNFAKEVAAAAAAVVNPSADSPDRL